MTGDTFPRTALVTGASSGIGRAVSLRLAEGGTDVLMVARGEGRLAAAAGEVGGRMVPADVSTPEGIARIGEEVRFAWEGAPELVVNAAGTFLIAPFVSTSADDVETQLRGNLLGPFRVIREFLPAMLERGSGRIINIGSVAGRTALPGNAAYSASKYGLRGMHEVLVAELRGSGVSASLVDPSATDTPLWDPVDPDRSDELPSRGEMLDADRVAEAVVFAATRPLGVTIPTLSIQAG